MNDLILGLVVMASIVNGAFLFGLLWLRVGRRQTREADERGKRRTPFYPEGQETFTFIASRHELETMAGTRRQCRS